MIPSAVFPGHSTTDQISLSSKFEKSWEYAKDVYTCFVNLEKAYDRVPRDRIMLLTPACCWPSTHCIPDQKFVSMSGELNHDQ